MTMIQFGRNPDLWFNTEWMLGWVYDGEALRIVYHDGVTELVSDPEIAGKVNEALQEVLGCRSLEEQSE